jgi:hypothetical protein
MYTAVCKANVDDMWCSRKPYDVRGSRRKRLQLRLFPQPAPQQIFLCLENLDVKSHLGAGAPATNCVLMIALDDEAAPARLIEAIVAANLGIKRADDRIRLFQLPLKRVI